VSDPTASELRATVDELAIRGLVAAYADIVNRRTWSEFSELFVADAPVTLDLRDRPPMEFGGPVAIGDFIAGALEQYPFFEFVALNVRVWFGDADPDRAQVRTYMCELRQDHDGAPSRAFGVYQDVVTRDPQRPRHWRFARRHYQSMGRGEYGLDLMPMPDTEIL
jgi:hypothetical protein